MDILRTELPKFGINIKLDTYDNMLIEFTKLITLEKPLLNTFFNFKYIPESYDFEVFTGSENKKYKFLSFLSEGSFNQVHIYLDEDSQETVIVRNSVGLSIRDPKNIEKLFKTFYENLKHIILYILIRHSIGNCKFIPKPFYFISNNYNDYFEFIMIMEKGEYTLQDYIEDNYTNMDLIRKQFYSIYKDLYQLEFIKFRHGDMKINNIVISKKLNPLIIDFGFSQFIIDGIKFENLDDISVANNPFYTEPYYNQVQDIIQLITSVNFIKKEIPQDFDPYKIFEFIKNKKSNILDGELLKEKMKLVSPENNEYFTDLFKLFYSKYDFTFLKIFGELAVLEVNPGLISISPEELADNIGINPKDYLIETYEHKYLKYKMKYLNLKNNLINKHGF